MTCWLFHKWGTWMDVTFNKDALPMLGQTRYCERCNKKQVRLVFL